MRRFLIVLGVIAGLAGTVAEPVLAGDFSFAFAWGDIARCVTGRPNRVDNPIFTLSDVPKGTATIRFRLKDLDAPWYDHGGGSVAFHGQTVVEPGAFAYNSPCPPGGSHTYEWTAEAVGSDGKTLGTAKARKDYP